MTTLTAENINIQSEIKQKTAKPLLWIGLMSIVMFFSGLTSAVFVSKANTNWESFEIPSAFLISTLIIVVSSITFHAGLISIKKDKLSISKMAFMITFLLAVAFGVSQYFAWAELYANGIVFSGGQSSAGSYFYAITGLHFAHVLGGIISLIIVLIKSYRGKYNSENYLGVQVSITYWHFLGALWVYLFFFLRFIA
jgi:cytochrome c oxidase subunit III